MACGDGCNVVQIENAIPFNGHSGDVIDMGCFFEPLCAAVVGFMEVLWRPAIGLPTMNGHATRHSGGWIAFTSVTGGNEPWAELVGTGGGSFLTMNTLYWGGVVPLSIALLLVATGFVTVRAGSLGRVESKRLLRRLGIAFLTCFFWLPVASIALRFFNDLAYYIMFGMSTKPPADQIADALLPVLSGGFILGTVGGGTAAAVTLGYIGLPVAILLLLPLLLAVVFTLAFLAMRWILVIVITVSMPLIAVFWAVDVWPLDKFSDMASTVTGTYAGLLVSGLPTAMLFRVLMEAENGFGLPFGLVRAFVLLFILPYIVKTQVATTRWAAGMVAAEVATTGQQPLQRASRHAAYALAEREGEGDGDDDAAADVTRSGDPGGDAPALVSPGGGGGDQPALPSGDEQAPDTTDADAGPGPDEQPALPEGDDTIEVESEQTDFDPEETDGWEKKDSGSVDILDGDGSVVDTVEDGYSVYENRGGAE